MSTLAFNPNLDRQYEIAEKARRLSQRIQATFYGSCPAIAEADSKPAEGDGSMEVVKFRNLGLRVVARSMLGSIAEYSGDRTTCHAIDLSTPALTEIAELEPEWEVPKIEHTWTAQSCQIREIAKRFNESIHADH